MGFKNEFSKLVLVGSMFGLAACTATKFSESPQSKEQESVALEIEAEQGGEFDESPVGNSIAAVACVGANTYDDAMIASVSGDTATAYRFSQSHGVMVNGCGNTFSNAHRVGPHADYQNGVWMHVAGNNNTLSNLVGVWSSISVYGSGNTLWDVSAGIDLIARMNIVALDPAAHLSSLPHKPGSAIYQRSAIQIAGDNIRLCGRALEQAIRPANRLSNPWVESYEVHAGSATLYIAIAQPDDRLPAGVISISVTGHDGDFCP